MIPEPSALNWSSEKPTYDEAKGKKIVFEWACFGGKSMSANIVYDRNAYNDIFDDLFIRYAIIADQPEPELLELGGVKARIGITLLKDWCWIWNSEVETHSRRGYPDKLAAITEWNKFVTTILKGRER